MNILLTNRCNRSCSYCFLKNSLASPEDDGSNIELEDFAVALHYFQDLVAIGAKKKLNLMGGEPTLHPHFETILNMVRSPHQQDYYCRPAFPVCIFSNGLFDRDTATLITQEPCGLMLNINDPDSYSPSEWSQLEENLESLSSRRHNLRPFSFSFNLYHPEQDFSFLMAMSKTYGVSQIRVDISRPNLDRDNRFVTIQQISKMIPLLSALSRACTKQGIRLITDCCIPVCALSNRQLQTLVENGVKLSFRCSGAIDVNYDLELWYCAPMRAIPFGRVTDYSNGREILAALEEKTRVLHWEAVSFERCKSCKWKTLRICQGGCLSLKEGAPGNEKGNTLM